MKLRPYQIELVNNLVQSFKNGNKRVLMVLPTGGGKTAVATHIALKALAKSNKVLYLVHRRELLKQAFDTMVSCGLRESKVGLISGDVTVTPWNNMQIATVQTITRRFSNPSYSWLKPDIIVVDEAHHVAADTWRKVIDHYKESFALGMTATPVRLDGQGLGTVFDDLVAGHTTKELIDLGSLCDLDFYTVPVGIDLDNLKKQGGDYSRSDQSSRINSRVIINTCESIKRYAKNKQAIHYACSVEHSVNVVTRLLDQGISACHIDAMTDNMHREAVLAQFKEKKIQIISNVDLITEGFDCPSCECVVMARKTSSFGLYKQMIGRVMRPKPDGSKGLVLDLVNNASLGSPIFDPEWLLTFDDEEGNKKMKPKATKTCPSCGLMQAMSKQSCASCGYKWGESSDGSNLPVEVIMRLDKLELIEPKKIKRKPKLSQTELRQRIYATRGDTDKLHALCDQMGYKKSAIHLWRKKYKLPVRMRHIKDAPPILI